MNKTSDTQPRRPARPRRKSDPMQALKKFVLSAFVVFSFVAYAIHDRLTGSNTELLSQDSLGPQPATGKSSGPNGSSDNSGSLAVANQATSTSVPQPTLVVPTYTPEPTNVPPATNTPVPLIQSAPTNQPLPTKIPPTSVPPTKVPPTKVPPTNIPAPTATPKGAYRDGQYTGPVTDAYYGNVQVRAIIQGGKLTDVKWLDFPHDRRTSQMINQQATPWLRQEAIQAQSAQVDFVSGATLTSQAFVQSLQAALSQAAN
jgi:uncharacterized protein with FMN-binding domain